MKKIEYEVEKAIILALVTDKIFPYRKLYNVPEIKKYSEGSLLKYLEKLSEEGIIQMEKKRAKKKGGRETSIWLDPDSKNRIKQLLEKLDEATKSTDELVEGYIKYVDFYEQNPAKYKEKSSEVEAELLGLLNKEIARWFESYFSVIFMNISGSIPAVMGKYGMLNYELQSKKIEKLLKKIKKVHPITYSVFLTHASGRFRLSV